jgi:hypothetical protein
MPQRNPLKQALLGLATLVLAAMFATPAYAKAPSTQPEYSSTQLREDLTFMMAGIRATDPDLGHSADVEKLHQQLHRIEADLGHPMTRSEAWMAFGTLNPLLADGHLGVTFPDWQGATKAHLAEGGLLFPFEVIVSQSGEIRIQSKLGGSSSPLAGRRILRINGHPADSIAKALLARMYGDTPAFRAGLLSNRFWFFYWQVYGAPKAFDLALEGAALHHMRVAASHAQPRYLVDQTIFDRAFQFRLLGKHVALMTINVFYWPDSACFLAFTRNAFRTIAQKGVTTLIIDIRQNGGGDDDLWMKGILRYIATKPYRTASTYVKKVIPHHQDPGQKIGEVVHGALNHWIQPDRDNPLHFSGKLYVLIGGQTYSSSVLFSNVVQDFNFGKLVGQGGVVRASQSGGIQDVNLPNTGLNAFSPRFIMTRPSGKAQPEFLQPDIPLQAHPLHPDETISALLKLIQEPTLKTVE